MRAVVKPNVDTYYNIARLDLAKEPIILKMPATEWYYLMQFLDGYTNVLASIGSRTNGSGAGEFAIVGPQWTGDLSDNVEEFRSPTNMVWMLGRIQTNNGHDGNTVVRAIQDSMRICPLSTRGRTYSPPTGSYDQKWEGVTPIEIMEELSIEEAMELITTLMKENPASPRDSNLIYKMAQIGIEAGKVPQLEFDNHTQDKKYSRFLGL